MTVDEFGRLVVSSGLLTEERESALRAGSGAASADSYSNYLVANSELTDWQADKLIKGKWKGFFIDQYKILYHLDRGEDYSLYSAENVETGAVVKLKIHLPRIR